MSIQTLKLKIVTPERMILEEEVEQVTLPTTEGEITVLPGHVPLIASLGTGEIIVKHSVTHDEENESPMSVSGGFVEIKPDSEVIVLANTAERVSEIDVERAKKRATELMEMKHTSDVDFEHFEAELERSLNRVKIADKWRSKKYRK